MSDPVNHIINALDALCDAAFSLPSDSKARQKCVSAEKGLRNYLEKINEEKVPYAWEVRQNGRVFLVPAMEFIKNSYDQASFIALYR